MENGMREEPQRRGGPQPNTALRSDHADAKSYAEEQLNNPNIADEALIKETSFGDTWDEFIPHQWSDEHKEPVYGEKYSGESHHYDYHYQNGTTAFCHLGQVLSVLDNRATTHSVSPPGRGIPKRPERRDDQHDACREIRAGSRMEGLRDLRVRVILRRLTPIEHAVVAHHADMAKPRALPAVTRFSRKLRLPPYRARSASG